MANGRMKSEKMSRQDLNLKLSSNSVFSDKAFHALGKTTVAVTIKSEFELEVSNKSSTCDVTIFIVFAIIVTNY